MEDMDTTVAVIDRVLGLQPARLLSVDDFLYIDKDKNVQLFTPPVPSSIDVATLSGFVQLLETGFEGFDAAKCIVRVVEFDEVHLLAKESDKWGRRQTYVRAKAMKPERQFAFNTFQSQETFNIALRSMFVDTAELQALLAVSGNLAKELNARQEDDGFSQRVTVKSQVVLTKDITINPRVTLEPFRTFLEVDQPKGDFIFRVRHDEDKGNLCALFEADAGRWKLTAMETVKKWLENRLHSSHFSAVNDIPVVA